MKELPIPFSDAMILALLERRKTQTRRLISLKRWHRTTLPKHLGFMNLGDGFATLCGSDYPDDDSDEVRCRYGKAGDVLYVREAFACASGSGPTDDSIADTAGVIYRADGACVIGDPHADGFWLNNLGYKARVKAWRPPMHLPKWASRIELERVGMATAQQLHEITEEDAVAEGCVAGGECGTWAGEPDDINGEHANKFAFTGTARGAYARLIDELHGPGTWKSRPWVWRIPFRVRTILGRASS